MRPLPIRNPFRTLGARTVIEKGNIAALQQATETKGTKNSSGALQVPLARYGISRYGDYYGGQRYALYGVSTYGNTMEVYGKWQRQSMLSQTQPTSTE